MLVLGKQLELDVDKEDIHELLGIEAEEPSNEELTELEEERSKEVEAEEEEVIPEAPRKFTAKKLAEAFAAITSGVRKLEDMDVNYKRLARPGRQIQEALAYHREEKLCTQNWLSS